MSFINIIIKIIGRDSANPKIAKTHRFRHADERGLQGEWGGLQTACRVLARGLQSACKGCSAFAKAHFQCWELGIAPGGRVLHGTFRTLLHPLSPGLFFLLGLETEHREDAEHHTKPKHNSGGPSLVDPVAAVVYKHL